MRRVVAAFPTLEEAHTLYDRLLANAPTASSDLVVAFLDPLAEWLARRYPSADPHDCDTAAEDAILNLLKHPTSYKPARQTLEVYLRMSALGDLKNVLRGERRHSSRRVALEVVEHAPPVGNHAQEDDPAMVVECDEVIRARLVRQERAADAVRHAVSPEESKVLELMQDRIRSVAAYAAVLRITHLPVEEQRQQVKRVKDRLTKRLQRATNDHAPQD